MTERFSHVELEDCVVTKKKRKRKQKTKIYKLTERKKFKAIHRDDKREAVRKKMKAKKRKKRKRRNSRKRE